MNSSTQYSADSLIDSLLGKDPSFGHSADSFKDSDEFIPSEVTEFDETTLPVADVEALILKFLLNVSSATGNEIADQLKLPHRLIDPLLRRLKEEQLTAYKGMGSLHDYIHEITELGTERAHRFLEQSTYFGAAPVSLDEYVAGINAQSIVSRKPTLEGLREAFSDLVLSDEMFRQIGRAIYAGRGLFLYGKPGNGKTSIAERISRSFGDVVWIPRTINVWGEIVRLYDPSCHEAVPLPGSQSLSGTLKHDRRWVRIRRPTIVVGGELSMEHLELSRNSKTGISEAPVQMKSNCGTLLVDDFGRQRVSEVALLNRWIVPLEKGFDMLCMGSGRKIVVPFDQMVVFSTNLEPRDLVDEAFLRRIPYKIKAKNPTESEYRNLFQNQARAWNIECPPELLEYLIEHHYQHANREMRCCHPRDLLLQIRNYCEFEQLPLYINQEALDSAVESYFGMFESKQR